MLQGHVPGLSVHELSAPCAVNGAFFGRYSKPELRNEKVGFNFDRVVFLYDGIIFLMELPPPEVNARSCSGSR